LSLTVPIVNSLAFLLTVLGDWVVDRKPIPWGEYVGIGFVCGEITMCVHSKN
ncbi:hypothetical protein K440DRAFT_558676, partial [Wilcoxina mikolae CBS 423.85]